MNQGWKVIAGPVLVAVLASFLSEQAQGFWFTFLSLGGLIIFADLGFTSVIIQLTAHEYSDLSISEGVFQGDVEKISKISSLYEYSVSWSSSLGRIVVPLIVMVGGIIFINKNSTVDWLIPWIIFSISIYITFNNNIKLSFFEGCNLVGDIQKKRFYVSFIMLAVVIIGLFFKIELYALSIGSLMASIAGYFIIYKSYNRIIRQMKNQALKSAYKWRSEIQPLILKTGISWISGYFIFQSLTPIAFQYYGPIEAGKVGLSIALATAIYNLSNIFFTIKIPLINYYVAKQNYKLLNSVIYKTMLLSCITFIVGSLLFMLLIEYIKELSFLSNRLINHSELIIFLLAWFIQVIINSIAIYIRAHKVEPFAIVSLLNAIYIFLVTIFIASHYDFKYFFLGYVSNSFIALLMVLIIFRNYYKVQDQ